MALAIVYARANQGVEAPLVSIEVHLANGLPCFHLVGLGDATVRESRERVRSALINSGFEFPAKRITVNLAPADLPKDGGRFDLAIAIGIIAASHAIPQTKLDQIELLGELALDGSVRPVPGIIPMIVASKKSDRDVFLPTHNLDEASLIQRTRLYPVSTLLEVYHHLQGQQYLQPAEPINMQMSQQYEEDLQDIIGQSAAKRALEIAAAGRHNILFTGPPGTGKSMLAKRLISLLPEMSEEQSLEVAAIHSVAGLPIEPANWRMRKFRQPHHTSSAVAIAGGGAVPKPGEISLAHQGILFLDELPEFERRVIDSLREPLETHSVCISRAAGKTTYPAKFQLIAAMNPSPTGDLHDGRASSEQVRRYLQKISGPFLERIDMQVDVPKLNNQDYALLATQPRETSEDVRARVQPCYELQLKRNGKPNAELTAKELQEVCYLSPEDNQFLHKAVETLGLSMRAYHRLLKVARTIADLEQAPNINQAHLLEAMSYRSLDAIFKHLSAH